MIHTIINFFRKLFGSKTAKGEITNVSSPPPVIIPPLKLPPLAFPVILSGQIDCIGDELQMIRAAFTDLSKVLASPTFKTRVLAAHFSETNDLSNIEIYNMLISKSPVYINFSMFTGSFKQNHIYKTMGYEDENYPSTCFANRYFIQNKETCASLILHEAMHVLGFHHYGVMNTSVPYTMNDIYSASASELHLDGELAAS